MSGPSDWDDSLTRPLEGAAEASAAEGPESPAVGRDEWVARHGERRERRGGWLGTLEQRLAVVPWWAWLVLLTAAICLVPAVSDSGYVRRVAFDTVVFMLLALALNIVVGWGGLLDLGFVAFYGIGAYTYALLSSDKFDIHLPTLVVIPLVAIVGGIVGWLVGLPSRRLTGDYLAIVTLFFFQVFLTFTNNGDNVFGHSLTNGPNGILNVDEFKIFGWDISRATSEGLFGVEYLYVALGLFVVVYVLLHLLNDSRTGRAWRSLREDPLAAELMGMPVNRLKLMAFAFGASVAATTGTLSTALNGSVFPQNFEFPLLITIYTMVILGGAGSQAGVVLGRDHDQRAARGSPRPGRHAAQRLLPRDPPRARRRVPCVVAAGRGPRRHTRVRGGRPPGCRGHRRLLDVRVGRSEREHRLPGLRLGDRPQPTRRVDLARLVHRAHRACAPTDARPRLGPDRAARADPVPRRVRLGERDGPASGVDAVHRARRAPRCDDGRPAAGSPRREAGGDRMSGTPLLELERVSMAFGGLTCVSKLDLHVDEGEIVSVIGPNGAGKTTLFNLVTGVYEPTEGDIRFAGESITGLEPHKITRKGIARTFQTLRLFLNMTVRENVMAAAYGHTSAGAFRSMFRTPGQRREEREIRELAEKRLAFFGERLTGYRWDQPAYSLSYANRRRLEIARATATNPRMLLLDEPAAGMNPRETQEITELIAQLRSEGGYTILVIEHDMHVVEGISDRVVALDHGVKIAEGTFGAVATDPRVVEAYLGTGGMARK